MTEAEIALLTGYMVDGINASFAMFIDLLDVWVVLLALVFLALGVRVILGSFYGWASSRVSFIRR